MMNRIKHIALIALLVVPAMAQASFGGAGAGAGAADVPRGLVAQRGAEHVIAIRAASVGRSMPRRAVRKARFSAQADDKHSAEQFESASARWFKAVMKADKKRKRGENEELARTFNRAADKAYGKNQGMLYSLYNWYKDHPVISGALLGAATYGALAYASKHDGLKKDIHNEIPFSSFSGAIYGATAGICGQTDGFLVGSMFGGYLGVNEERRWKMPSDDAVRNVRNAALAGGVIGSVAGGLRVLPGAAAGALAGIALSHKSSPSACADEAFKGCLIGGAVNGLCNLDPHDEYYPDSAKSESVRANRFNEVQKAQQSRETKSLSALVKFEK